MRVQFPHPFNLNPFGFYWIFPFEPHTKVLHVPSFLIPWFPVKDSVLLQLFKIFKREIFNLRNLNILSLILNQRRLIQSQIINTRNFIYFHIWRKIQPKGIITHLFQNLEWTISNWFQIFTFLLESFLANVKPKFISHLEIVIHMMLIMSCIVLRLTLFQLFLNCLMQELNLFNEYFGLIYVTMSINRNIFPKDKI